ncbi:MAG: SDR family NAD(P)-dependent oxidoreductase [Streptosporangiales bacterium]|nr:SDR family NAD(P)-dependent oxidoreductase [Streptosporangiales bacterium]
MYGLTDKGFVVAGGAGVAGECVTLALLRRGARVVVPSRTSERIERLRSGVEPELLPRLHTLVGDVGNPTDAEEIRDRVSAEFGPIDGVVASLGAWWEGNVLTEVPFGTWQRVLHDNLTAHFLVARTFLPELADRPGTVYVALAGIAAIRPIAGSGPISVTGAAQTMLLRTLEVELADAPVRLHEVAVLTPIVTRHWPAGDPVERGWLSGEQVGEYVASVASPDFPDKTSLGLRIPADWEV